MQHLAAAPPASEPVWNTPIVQTVASDGTGIADLAVALDDHATWLHAEGVLHRRRRDRAHVQVKELALGMVRSRFVHVGEGDLVDRLADSVAAQDLDPYTAADELVASLG